MRRKAHTAFLSALTLAIAALAACTSVPLDTTKLATVHTIALDVIEPRFDILGGLGVPTADDTGADFDGKVRAAGLRLGPETTAALTAALSADGYRVTTPGDGAADAVLTIKFTPGGYVAMPILFGGTCDTALMLEAGMTEARTGAVIVHHVYFYSQQQSAGMTDTIILPADPKYRAADCATLLNDPQLAVTAFRDAEPAIARAIATELARH